MYDFCSLATSWAICWHVWTQLPGVSEAITCVFITYVHCWQNPFFSRGTVTLLSKWNGYSYYFLASFSSFKEPFSFSLLQTVVLWCQGIRYPQSSVSNAMTPCYYFHVASFLTGYVFTEILKFKGKLWFIFGTNQVLAAWLKLAYRSHNLS